MSAHDPGALSALAKKNYMYARKVLEYLKGTNKLNWYQSKNKYRWNDDPDGNYHNNYADLYSCVATHSPDIWAGMPDVSFLHRRHRRHM